MSEKHGLFFKELEELFDGNLTFCGLVNTRESSIFQERKRQWTDKKEDNDEEDDEEGEEEKKNETKKKGDVHTIKKSASNEMVDFLKENVKAQNDIRKGEKEVKCMRKKWGYSETWLKHLKSNNLFNL